MKTRDRILESALLLFNQEGVATVSTNRIASELEISPGNLYYHFKSKEQLVEWLVRRLEHEMAPLRDSCASLTALDDFWLTLHLMFETIEKYRFIYVDIDFLARSYPRLGQRVKTMTDDAINSMRSMVGNLAEAGVIIADNVQLDSLAFHIVFIATCWSTFVKLLPISNPGEIQTGLAAFHSLTLLNPYLSQDARHYMHYLRQKYLK